MADESPRRRARIAPFVALAAAVVLGGLVVVLAGSDAAKDETVSSFLLDKPAPPVVSTTLDGAPFDLSRRKGSWVVLNFFDPDCVPCEQEHPELIALAQQQSALGGDGAELYTVINKGTDEAVRSWFDAKGGDWPKIRDPAGAISVAFGVAQVPETWIVDPNGVVRARFVGEVTAEGVGAVLQRMRETMA